VFKPKPEEKKWFRPSLNPIVVDFEGEYEIAGIKVTTFPQIHGRLKTLGLRFGDFAYSTDTNNLSDDAFKRLEGVKIWVVDCLSFTEKPSHAHLDLTLSWINRVKPDLAVLTHMSHEFDYDELLRNLPQGVEPAYDGMVLTLED
jgi:phosphoribosyl 1,2-cyclic phosphate phosphodiesterase